jgi:hypothetical protein
MEFCNQALEQEVFGSPDHYTFGVTLDEAAGFTSKGRTPKKTISFCYPRQEACI